MTAQITTVAEAIRDLGHLAPVTSLSFARITMVEQLLDRADVADAERVERIARHCPRQDSAAEVEHVIKLHAELLAFLPPDAVPSPDEENEYEALAYELYAAIKKLVSTR